MFFLGYPKAMVFIQKNDVKDMRYDMPYNAFFEMFNSSTELEKYCKYSIKYTIKELKKEGLVDGATIRIFSDTSEGIIKEFKG